MIRVIVADDHAIVRTGLRQLMERAQDIEVVAETDNGHDLLQKIQSTPCDLVLQDMSLHGLAGIDLLRRARETRPQLPVLILSMHNDGQVAGRALRAGASGYVTKDSEPEILIAAIRKIAGGGRFIDPSLVDKIVFDVGINQQDAPHLLLSNREFQIFQMLIAGLSAADIADKLALSKKTVSTYKARLFQKLEVRNIVGLVRYADEHGVTA